MPQQCNENYSPNTLHLKDRLTSGFSEIIEDRVKTGCSCHLITILFGQLYGSKPKQIDQMKDAIQRVYSTFLTRVHRKPKSAPTHELPFLIGALDLPVCKLKRGSTPLVRPNDGLHFHGVLMVPQPSRLKDEVSDHFTKHPALYGVGSTSINRIDVRPVTHDRTQVLDYVLKTVGNGRLTYDDAIVILPRSKSEL